MLKYLLDTNIDSDVIERRPIEVMGWGRRFVRESSPDRSARNTRRNLALKRGRIQPTR